LNEGVHGHDVGFVHLEALEEAVADDSGQFGPLKKSHVVDEVRRVLLGPGRERPGSHVLEDGAEVLGRIFRPEVTILLLVKFL
jgi:hypothetical protein